MKLTIDQLNKLQETERKMAFDFEQYCDRVHLVEFADGGTMLGAVRSHGFIPWDDDVDMSMPLDDYLKFTEIFREHPIPGYFLQTQMTDPFYLLPWAKLRKENTAFVETAGAAIGKHHEIYIDIFPLIHVPDNRFRLKLLDVQCRAYFSKIDKALKGGKEGCSFFKRLLVSLLTGFVSPNNAANKLFLIMEKSNQKYKKSNTIGTFWYGITDYPSSVFTSSLRFPFDSISINVPCGYDQYLKRQYGDYLTLPPESDREPHHYIDYISFDHSEETI